MPRNITVTMADGTRHVYNNAPDNVTPEQVTQRAQREFGQAVRALDGGRAASPAATPRVNRDRQFQRFSGASQEQAQTAASEADRAFRADMTRRGIKGPALERAIATFHSDPRYQALAARTQNRQAPTLRQARIRQGAQANAAEMAKQGDFGTAFLGSVSRNTFGIPERLAAAGLRWLPTAVTGNGTDASYDDILEVVRANTDAQMERSAGGNFIGALVGGGAAGLGIGSAARSIATRAAAAASPTIARGGNILRSVMNPVRGQTGRNIARAAAGGGALGGLQAAGEGSSVTTGAAAGAAGGAVLQAGAKAVGSVAKTVRNATGNRPEQSILRSIIRSSPDDIRANAARIRQDTGAEPTIYEALPLGDKQAFDQAISRMGPVARERMMNLAQDRARNIVRETGERVQEIVRPGAERIRSGIASDLARSRGATDATAEEITLASRASRSPLDMEEVADAEAANIMRPFDQREAYPRFSDLLPQEPRGQGATVEMVATRPDIASAIRGAAGRLALTDDPIRVRDITGIMSQLRRTATRSQSDGDRQTAQNAIYHLEDILGRDHPDVLPAVEQMRAAYGSRMRMSEGVSEGIASRLRENVDPGSTAASRQARNAYDTPEGGQGRTLGQASALEQRLLATPSRSISALGEIANDPTAQQAIARNIGSDEADQIVRLARRQEGAANRIGSLVREQTGDDGTAIDVFQNMMLLTPGTLPSTKIRGLFRAIQQFTRLPEAQSTNVVEMLLSQNPTQISRAIGLLQRTGDGGRQALQAVSSVLGAQAGPGAIDGSTQPGEAIASADPAPVDTGGESVPIEPEEPQSDDGLYDGVLQEIYDTENPALLDLVDRVSAQESGDRQFDANGEPITSSAGAIGVMQVMPDTAPEAARLAGLPWDESAYRNNPAYNKTIGIAYLSEMLRRFDGDVAKATAAYNAGAGNVNAAIRQDPDNWLAYLPAETQEYVRRVA